MSKRTPVYIREYSYPCQEIAICQKSTIDKIIAPIGMHIRQHPVFNMYIAITAHHMHCTCTATYVYVYQHLVAIMATMYSYVYVYICISLHTVNSHESIDM